MPENGQNISMKATIKTQLTQNTTQQFTSLQKLWYCIYTILLDTELFENF